jgi:O-antigen ligase
MKTLIAQTATFAAFTVLPLAVVGHKGEVLLLGGTALVLLYFAVRGRAWQSILRQRFLWLLLAVVAYGLATSPWAVVPEDAWRLAGALLGLFVATAVILDAATNLEEGARKGFAASAGSGFAFGCLLLLVELFGGMPITYFINYQGGKGPVLDANLLNPALSVLAIIVWPFVAAGQRFLGVVALTTATVIVLTGDMITARIAVAAGGVIFVLTLWLGRSFVRLLGTLAVLAVVLAPFAPALTRIEALQPRVEMMRSSVAHRLCIWEFTSARILEKPLLGWGLDSSRSIPGGEVECIEEGPSLSLHPHNAALQVWLELGLAGAFALAALVAMAFRAVAGLPLGVPVASGAAMLVAALTSAALSYGIWQNWWIATLALCAMFVRAALPAPKQAPPPQPKKKPQAAAPAAQPLAKIPTAQVPAALAKK